MDLLQRVCRPIHRWMDGCDAMRCCWHLEKSNSFCMRDDVSSFTSTPQWGNNQHAQIRMHWSTISQTLCYFSTTQNALSFKKGYFFPRFVLPLPYFAREEAALQHDVMVFLINMIAFYIRINLWVCTFVKFFEFECFYRKSS